MELTPFHLEISKDVAVHGEYVGDDSSGRVIIFSHGFGVRRDSLGMFTQLGALLEEKFLVGRFDYDTVDIEHHSSFVHPYHVQAKMLEAVVQTITQKFTPQELNIIAHSQGCFITGLASLSGIHKIILNSSPTASPHDRVRARIESRSGSVFNETGVSSLKRSDGSTTYFDSAFWQEMKAIRPLELYADLAKKTDLTFIRALDDEIVTDGQYDELRANTQLDYLEIPGNHNFSNGLARENWLKTIKTILK